MAAFDTDSRWHSKVGGKVSKRVPCVYWILLVHILHSFRSLASRYMCLSASRRFANMICNVTLEIQLRMAIDFDRRMNSECHSPDIQPFSPCLLPSLARHSTYAHYTRKHKPSNRSILIQLQIMAIIDCCSEPANEHARASNVRMVGTQSAAITCAGCGTEPVFRLLYPYSYGLHESSAIRIRCSHDSLRLDAHCIPFHAYIWLCASLSAPYELIPRDLHMRKPRIKTGCDKRSHAQMQNIRRIWLFCSIVCISRMCSLCDQIFDTHAHKHKRARIHWAALFDQLFSRHGIAHIWFDV